MDQCASHSDAISMKWVLLAYGFNISLNIFRKRAMISFIFFYTNFRVDEFGKNLYASCAGVQIIENIFSVNLASGQKLLRRVLVYWRFVVNAAWTLKICPLHWLRQVRKKCNHNAGEHWWPIGGLLHMLTQPIGKRKCQYIWLGLTSTFLLPRWIIMLLIGISTSTFFSHEISWYEFLCNKIAIFYPFEWLLYHICILSFFSRRVLDRKNRTNRSDAFTGKWKDFSLSLRCQ